MAALGDPPPAQLKTDMRDLLRPHVDSFDWFVSHGIDAIVDALPAEPFETSGDSSASGHLWIENVTLSKPCADVALDAKAVLPSECRQRGLSYRGRMSATVVLKLKHGAEMRINRRLGLMPIMLCSSLCHLKGLTASALAERHEERSELGGYFVCNGGEKAIRLLIVPRRNHPLGIVRPSFRNRGAAFTPYAVLMRCVGADQASFSIGVHLLSSGAARLRLTISKNEYFIPLVLLMRSLREMTDAEFLRRATGGESADDFVEDRVLAALQEHSAFGESLHSRAQCLAYLGTRFRVVLKLPASVTDMEAGEEVISRHVFTHLPPDDTSAKWELLLLLLQRLYALAAGRVAPDNPDSLVNQELLLPGHLWAMMVREKLGEWLRSLSAALSRDEGDPVEKTFAAAVRKATERVDIGKALTYFLATGNLKSETGLDLQQTSGFTIVAERLNYWRFLAHFRSVHRGAFFMQLRTTTVRKLLPDSWGFLCPVHTPDGGPCGLLNHLAARCHVHIYCAPRATLRSLFRAALAAGGAVLLPLANALPLSQYLPALFDGEVLGWVETSIAETVAEALRTLKLEGGSKLSSEVVQALTCVEIALVMPGGAPRPSALYIACASARPMRPVLNCRRGLVEQMGPLEQTTLRVACRKEEMQAGVHTHAELEPTNMLSLIANLTPFCDFNQSPRNMYQCQMGKQTMGTPFHANAYRAETKSYHLQTPQVPIVRTRTYSRFGLDEYAMGTNAVVAVISYTGYDMEDAMIVNKGSYERGFAHACVRTTVVVDLGQKRQRGETMHHRFGNTMPPDAEDEPGDDGGPMLFEKSLGPDGLPEVGARILYDQPLCAIYDEARQRHSVQRHKGKDEAFVEKVTLVGNEGEGRCEKAYIKLRYNRNPVPGDKFSSRHGQKGVMSRLWPSEDMPFSESGLVPDILFNPHGFPSRMTIGMLLESMAGKAGAIHGHRQDATPFQFCEKDRAVDLFGEQLRSAGYSHHGTETMYSGIYGNEMQVDIFLGVVYYQRLRHMVLDKHQVRARGPVNQLTRQPVHGRKIGGGIRLGEMERDALLAHGVTFLLQDRLLRCSDESRALVCTGCGSLLTAAMLPPRGGAGGAQLPHRQPHCRACGHGRKVEVVSLPFVFQYLTNELAAMNIKATDRKSVV